MELCLNTEVLERSCVPVISRLNSNKQVTTGLYRALNVEKKIWLIFVQGKHQQEM